MNSMSNPVPDRLLGDRRRVVVEHVRPASTAAISPPRPLAACRCGFQRARLRTATIRSSRGSGTGPVPGRSHPTRRRRGWSRCRWRPSPRTRTARGSSPDVSGLELRDRRDPRRLGGFARDLTIRFEAGVDVALDLADGAALAAARAELPVISKSDRRALSALATKLTAPRRRPQGSSWRPGRPRWG